MHKDRDSAISLYLTLHSHRPPGIRRAHVPSMSDTSGGDEIYGGGGLPPSPHPPSSYLWETGCCPPPPHPDPPILEGLRPSNSPTQGGMGCSCSAISPQGVCVCGNFGMKSEARVECNRPLQAVSQRIGGRFQPPTMARHLPRIRQVSWTWL